MELNIGDSVMVRDTWIECDYMIPPAKVIATKGNDVLLEFENKETHWFSVWQVKTE